ncbi:MAG TPA: DNA internalization-related competence protein ComEC/Rec2 [Deltaproteobacteria bacterium]|nr:DNA internalization-related competence protein ComEC/Rec2 [Deltaproteobacteria bacterium]
MLWHVGKTTPLAVVFVGICSGILLSRWDCCFLAFAVFFMILLVSKERFVHAAIGIIMGFVSMSLAPQWARIDEGQHLVEGRVEDAGFYHGTFRVVLDKVYLDHESLRGLAQLRVYHNVGTLRSGCLLRAYATIKTPRGFGNPGEFDYSEYLLEQGITLTGVVRDFTEIEITGSGSSSGFKDLITGKLSALARPEAEVLKAVLIGDRSGLAYSLRDDFAALGIAHLLAISGLHMGIIIVLGYVVLFTIVRLIPPLALRYDTPFMAKTGGLVCAFVYTIFVGATIPTLRAMIMASCLIGALAFLRKAYLLESLAVAGIIILIFWPVSLHSPSFVLSFSAVVGIIAAYSRFEHIPAWLMSVLIPIGASIFTLPAVVYVFGFVSPLGIISNLVCVPLFSFIIMPLGLMGLLAAPLSDGISSLLFSVSMDGIGIILRVSDMLGTLKPVIQPSILWVFASYAGLFVAFFGRSSRIKSIILILCSLMVFFVPIISQMVRVTKPLCFNFISVGQGDSTLVTNKSSAMLIDAGGSYSGFDTGRFIVAPHLLRKGITHLNIVVITHFHPDHAGGMPFILDRFEVGEIWTNIEFEKNRYSRDIMRIARRKFIPVRSVNFGDTYELDGMKISVLNPSMETGTDLADQNLLSIVVRIDDGNMSGLFMADADGYGEIMLSRLEQDLSADVLKVAHHGSKKSCTNMLLDRVNPDIAVISCGYENPYRLPNRDIINRLRKRGIQVYRTDLHGEISVCPGKMTAKVKSARYRADIK